MNPVTLRPDKAAQLGEMVPTAGNRAPVKSEAALCPVVGDAHEKQAAHLLPMCQELTSSPCVILVVQFLEPPSAQVR